MPKRVFTGKYAIRKKSKAKGAPGSAILASTYSRTRTRPTAQTWPYSSQSSYLNIWDPFPAKQMARMRYSTDVTITPGTGSAGVHTFAANGLFDPDITGTGHQPYGYDTYATLFFRYKVLKATIVVRPTSNTNCIYGVNISPQAAPIVDYDLIKERKGCRMAVCNSNAATDAVVQYYNSDYYGSDDNLHAFFTSNPSEIFYFNVWCTMQTASATGAARDFSVTITYDVEMWDPKALAKS